MGARILVIEDNPANLELARYLLAARGHEVLFAIDGATGVLLAQLEQPDLVLSDLHLGSGPDGVEVIANVRRLCGREVPAILVTGDTAPEQIRHVSDRDVAVLFKPVQPRRLFEALRDALR